MSLPRHIRIANESDAVLLADLAYKTFSEAFTKRRSESSTGHYLRSLFTVENIAREITQLENRFLLAFCEDELVGYAKLRKGLSNWVGAENSIELQRLYADQLFIGAGVGSDLMEEIIVDTSDLGFQAIWLGVWEKNLRAIKFYERWGFEVMDSSVVHLDSNQRTDLIMFLPLV